MAISVTTARRVQLQYTNGTASFNKFLLTATEAKMYDLGCALNKFQLDKAVKILSVKKAQIV